MDGLLELIAAVLTLSGILITGFASLYAKINSYDKAIGEINDAVNHRHIKTNSDDAPKLYDLAWENHQKVDELVQWKRGYDGGPLDSGAKVDEFVGSTKERLEDIEKRLGEGE